MAAITPLDTVLHSTLTKSRKKLAFAAIKSNAFYAWATANNRLEFEDGGWEISNPLIVGRNPNVGTYQYYEPVPIGQTNELTTVRYSWSRFAGSLIISDQEQDENTGPSQVAKLLTVKMQVLEESMTEKFSTYLYGAGSGTDPYGLAALIPDDPTSGSIGGRSRVTERQWRTSAFDFNGGLDETNIEEAFDDVEMDLTVKKDSPDLVLCGRNLYRLYRAAVRSKFTIPLTDGGGSGKAMYDLGFKGVTHGGITMLYDEDCPVNKAYWINSKYIRMHVLKGVNFKVKELVAPWTIDAIGRRIIWQGQMCIWNAYRKHAVVINE